MRVNLKSGAASAAAVFMLLLILSLTWPGHGVWSLVVGILIGLAAAYLWWRDSFADDRSGQSPAQSSAFSNVGAYGLSGAALESSRQPTSGVPLFGILASISALAILFFVAGSIGSADDAAQETPTALDGNVAAIDRSRDGEPVAPQVAPPASSQIQQSQTTAVAAVSSQQTSTTTPEASTQTQQTAPVKPIVVAAPQTASAAEDEADNADLVPESANTFEYTVEEGDTLYEIAERYDSTVDAIMTLNQLDATSFIHPGDTLLIPILEDDGEES